LFNATYQVYKVICKITRLGCINRWTKY